MQKKKSVPITEKDMQPIWLRLMEQERLLKRNQKLCLILQPVGLILFTLGLAFLFFGLKDTGTDFLSRLPALPDCSALLPKLPLYLLLAFLFPLAINGAIAAIFYYRDRKMYSQNSGPLNGTPAQCAKALVYKAEAVYELRQRIQIWPIYIPAGILTAFTAMPFLRAWLETAEKGSAVFQLALYALALLLVLFVLFWFYVLLFYLFSLLNSLFFRSGRVWSYYELYQKLDAYWESVDPKEYGRHEYKKMREAQRKSRRHQV